MFMAFLKLHKKGPAVKNGYWINGGKIKIALFGIVPFLLLLVALFFTLFPSFEADAIKDNLPLIIGACIAIVLGEIMVNRRRKDSKPTKTISKTTKTKKSTKRVAAKSSR